MTHEVVAIPGDGVGREVVPAAVRVLEATTPSIRIEHHEAGDAVRDERGTPLPDETVAAVERADATLFGAAGETAADVILPLREAVGSFANLRPARAYPGVDAVAPETDLVIVRENTEGVYGGIEARVADGVRTTTRVVTRDASRRIAAYACEVAADRGTDEITVAHKANVMRETDGLFLESVRAVADEQGVGCELVLMDALATDLVRNPGAYDVICTPNLAGDVLSDLTAGLVGGLGMAPSANVGPDNAVFEPVHGTAPDIAGDGVANPVAAILSAAHLLAHRGEERAARRVRTAVRTTLAAGPQTPDLGGSATTARVTDAVIDRL